MEQIGTAGRQGRLSQAAVAPVVAYVILAALFLGTAAYVSSANMLSDPPNRDIWQHAAALRALMTDLADPANPFVAGSETSRHFHPLWVGAAAAGGALGLSVWQVLTLASYAFMAILALGIYLFARAYFRRPWAPVVLLVVMLFGWAVQHQHTGSHAFQTLLYGAAYPATALIGFSLIAWALVLEALRDPRVNALLLPVVALMVATHQLGAAIGLVGVGCFILLAPQGGPRHRMLAALTVVLGCALALAWPYYNPVTLVLQPGNSSWEGGPRFLDFAYFGKLLIPSALGVLGLAGARARPLALALVLYTALFLLSGFGIQVAGRFLMPIILVMHIGLAGLLLEGFGRAVIAPRTKKALVAVAAVPLVVMYLTSVWFFLRPDPVFRTTGTPVYEAALRLTEEIPDREAVAAADLAAWPVVATGQRVLSIPWPEPGIADLAERQAATRALFDPALSREARIALAREAGVRTLIADSRFVPEDTLGALSTQAVTQTGEGTLRRFDLYD